MATAVICVILAAVVCIGIRSFIKRSANGCCGGGDKIKKVKTDTNINHYEHRYIIKIEGMSCNHCRQTVENALNSLEGIYAKVDLKKNSAEIYTKYECEAKTLKKVVSACGFVMKDFNECYEK